jgi:hypothetical protein
LARKEDTNEESVENIITISSKQRITKSEEVPENAIGSKACSLCGVSFHTVEEQRSHTKSDLHGYNLKQKMRGQRAVSEGDFEKLIGGNMYNLLVLPTFLTLSRSR